jgi:hypothetical protein
LEVKIELSCASAANTFKVMMIWSSAADAIRVLQNNIHLNKIR